jgi:hypothetical protein
MGQWTLAKHQPLKTQKLRNTGLTGLPSELPIPNSFIKQSMQRDLQNKNDIDRGLVGRYKIFVIEVRPVFRNSKQNEKLDMPSLYWIPQLHKCPYI